MDQSLMFYNYIMESSDGSEEECKPPPQFTELVGLLTECEPNDLLHLLPFLPTRQLAVRVNNFIEIVQQFSHKEFITHFHLCRTTAYELIKQFEKSPIFQRIGNKGRAVISAEKHILVYLYFAGRESLGY